VSTTEDKKHYSSCYLIIHFITSLEHKTLFRLSVIYNYLPTFQGGLMRKLGMFSVLLLSGIFFLTTNSFSQEMKDQLYTVHEEKVKIDMWGQYESTSKQWTAMMTDAGLDISTILASQRDDGTYYYLVPISNYAELDKFQDIFNSAIKKLDKDKWAKLMEENNSSIASSKDFVVKWSSKYSYVPKNPRIKPEEGKFIHWLFFTYKTEKRKEVLGLLADWKALYEKENIPDGYSIWLMEMGMDNNMIVLSENAKDGASFYSNMKENSEKVKAEEQKLWEKFSPNILSIHEYYGRPRPDLSYTKK
jgi:hypothetical protein